MEIHDYKTESGKNLIIEYINKLPIEEKAEALKVRYNITKFGLEAFRFLNTRQLYKKLWEIKISRNRIMYVIADSKNVFFLHACKKQKDKAEKFELDKAIKRAKNINLL
ncbi:MAG: type II toxin-antitoxin system RelE/ParE family toxin [Oscillospiraceae bacterium]|nr:type II toxin-antitoxin system RelE/ParE family toxin [Oscillospiraceae bacterium]